MRKFVCAILFCLSQAISANDFSFAPAAGIVISHPKGYHTQVGFSIGVKTMYSLSDKLNRFYLSPGLSLVSRGWKDYIYDINDHKKEWICHPYYIEMPINIGYEWNINNLGLLLEVGPYIALGLFGSSEIGNDSELKISNIFSSNLYKRFDFGYKLNVGAVLHRWQITIGISHSLQKPSKDEWQEINPKDFSYHISFSYRIQ